MNTPLARTSILERLYCAALLLYPRRFGEAYTPAMHQAFRDALRDPALSRFELIRLVLRDLIVSIAKECLSMVHESLARPILVFNALVLAGIATGGAFALYAIPQQVLRSGLNDPQIQLAGDDATKLERGSSPSEAVGLGEQIDMARSLAPFLIVYDDQGRPVASQAILNRAVPAPPRGVFEYVREHGQERVSWQPVLGRAGGVRIASIVQRVGGAHPGFVLAGRNMREVEAREEQVLRMAGLTWLGMLGLIAVGLVVFGWYARPRNVVRALSSPTA